MARSSTTFERGHSVSEAIREKLSLALKGQHHSPATEIKGGQHISPATEFKKGQLPWNIGLTKETDERVRLVGQHTGESLRGRRLTKEQIKIRLRRRIPSSLEEKFQTIVTKCNLPYKYVGNGSFIIGHYNPDFININGEKIAVEVYAKYYKKRNSVSIEQWRKERAEIFKEYGWRLIYFDETEVNESKVLKILGGKTNGKIRE